MKRLKLSNQHDYVGDFVIDNSYSIGDYIKITLLTEPIYLGLSIPGGSVPVIGFHVRIDFSSEREPFEAVLMALARGLVFRHWIECLEVGKTHCIRAVKCKHPDLSHIWYTPEIDGQLPGMCEKVKS